MEPMVREGQLLCLRLFDIGDEISLDRAAELLRKVDGVLQCDRRGMSKMKSIAAPLRLELGMREIEIIELPNWIKASLSVHIYDSGSVSVTYAIDIAEGTTFKALTPQCAALYQSTDLATLARQELAKLLPVLQQAISGFHEWSGHENYTIIRIYELSEGITPKQFLEWKGLGRLLIGEPSELRLEDRHRAEVLEYSFGYLENDLAIIDWNSALLVDPRRDPTLVEMLEFANSHLLNLRYYDHVLDKHTKKIYGELSVKHSGIMDRTYARLAQDLFKQLVGLSEITERIDNATKVVGDYYTARVYRAAIKRMRVESWKQSIERKQRLVNEAYDMLKGQVEMRRSFVIEITIVLLILIEVVMAFIPGLH